MNLKLILRKNGDIYIEEFSNHKFLLNHSINEIFIRRLCNTLVLLYIDLKPLISLKIVIIAIACTAIIDDYVFMILLLKGNKVMPKLDLTRYNS